MPKLEIFPVKGILQFYVLPNDIVGMNGGDNLARQDTFRVIYHKEILSEDMMRKDFPLFDIKGIAPENEGDGWFPFEEEFCVEAVHSIGGNPTFIQTDPRACAASGLKEYDNLLLQIASEFGVESDRDPYEKNYVG